MQIGHVHLSVADLDRSTDFYRDGLGLEVTADAAVVRVEEHGFEVDRGRDHGATVSVYLYDPDRNGIELYDRPREHWYDEAGNPVLRNDPLDPHELP